MAREILQNPNNQISEATSATVAVSPLVAQSPVHLSGDASQRDALAGAFPEWDLMPAVPFVRRLR